VPTFTYLAALPFAYRGLARRFVTSLGVHDATFRGRTAPEILSAARDALSTQRRGLFLFHWPDADAAGHAHGWTSRQYVQAARRMDDTLGKLDALSGLSHDPATLLVVLSDHGGGGVLFRDHDSDHPHDRTIPIVLAGGRVRPTLLPAGTSLLDVPATVLWAMGVRVPSSYAGRPLSEAFVDDGADAYHDAGASASHRAVLHPIAAA
jgi:arylsulfatase A-like enzyme